MSIRTASSEDAEAITRIWNKIIRDPLITFTDQEKTTEAMVQRLAAARVFLVAEDSGKIMGFATYGPFRAGPGYAHTAELTIILAENTRGAGVGRRLMLALLEQAKGQGIHVMIAGISAENPVAIGFHKAMGFETVGQLPQVGFKQGR